MARLTRKALEAAAKSGDWGKVSRIARGQMAKDRARILRMRDVSPYTDPLDWAGTREPKKDQEERPHDPTGGIEPGTVDREIEEARLRADEGDDREETVRPDIVRGSAKPARATSLGIERYLAPEDGLPRSRPVPRRRLHLAGPCRSRKAVSRHDPVAEMRNRANSITGPSHVIAAEVWGDREWRFAISSGGCSIQIGRLRERALVS